MLPADVGNGGNGAWGHPSGISGAAIGHERNVEKISFFLVRATALLAAPGIATAKEARYLWRGLDRVRGWLSRQGYIIVLTRIVVLIFSLHPHRGFGVGEW